MSSSFLRLWPGAVALLGGTVAGMALRGNPMTGHHGQDFENSISDPAEIEPAPKPESGGSTPAPPALPFSMERFQASHGLEMHRMLAQVLPGADAVLVAAIAHELSRREPKPLPDVVWQAVFVRWMRLEGPAAMAWARIHALHAHAMEAWAQADPGAAEVGADFGNKAERVALLQVLSAANPKRAIALYWDLSARGVIAEDKNGTGLVLELRGIWAEHDPAAALAEMQAHAAGKASSITRLSQGWAGQDPAACVAWILHLPLAQRNSALSGLREAAGKNPDKIAAALTGLSMDGPARAACMAVAKSWAEKAPAAALAWVRTRFPEGPQRADALMAVAGVLMEKDLQAAVAIMNETGWKDYPGQHAHSSRRILPGKDGKPDEDSTEEDTGDYDRPSNIIDSLLDRLTEVNPQEAVRAWEKSPAALQSDLAGTITLSWFRQDPGAAMAWLAALPEGKVMASYLATLVQHLDNVEPAARKEWALRLPPGPLQQAFAKSFAAELAL